MDPRLELRLTPASALGNYDPGLAWSLENMAKLLSSCKENWLLRVFHEAQWAAGGEFRVVKAC